MKKIFIMLFAVALIACNNKGSTDTKQADSTTIQEDNTINRDTGINPGDTMNRMDSIP